ncbi:hypothetical protein HIMB100_00010050 [SAR116 cluster alpha proteobacterium HIMB100]|nr:hypothetical protein HIMB100_00010050 [SAR116 cluster alpha proteobacterium HIMB100]
MRIKDNCDIGLKTRFGPDWPGKRCGAKTRAGGICPKPAYKDSGRCHNHGGASTGPKTKDGRQRVSEAHLKHGRYTKDKKEARKEGAAIERQLRTRRKLIENELKSAGII